MLKSPKSDDQSPSTKSLLDQFESEINAEHDKQKLKRLQEQINSRLNELGDADEYNPNNLIRKDQSSNNYKIKQQIGLEKYHMSSDHPKEGLDTLQKNPDWRKDLDNHNSVNVGFDMDKLQKQAVAIQSNMNQRRAAAGTVVVAHHLEADIVQLFLRSHPSHDRRRHSFRSHFTMWQDGTESTDIVKAKYLFILQKTTLPSVIEEAEFYNDMYFVDNIKLYNNTLPVDIPIDSTGSSIPSGESDFSLFIESLKLAATGSDNVPKSIETILSLPKTVNLFLKDTDIGKGLIDLFSLVWSESSLNL